jgi:hypothetical protein
MSLQPASFTSLIVPWKPSCSGRCWQMIPHQTNVDVDLEVDMFRGSGVKKLYILFVFDAGESL